MYRMLFKSTFRVCMRSSKSQAGLNFDSPLYKNRRCGQLPSVVGFSHLKNCTQVQRFCTIVFYRILSHSPLYHSIIFFLFSLPYSDSLCPITGILTFRIKNHKCRLVPHLILPPSAYLLLRSTQGILWHHCSLRLPHPYRYDPRQKRSHLRNSL